MSDDCDPSHRLREQFRSQSAAVPSGRITRLLKTGRAAIGMAFATLCARRDTEAIGSPGERPIEIAASRREVSSLMRDKRAVAKLALPGRLLFLFRLRFGLHSVLARVGAVADWSALESRWAEESASQS